MSTRTVQTRKMAALIAGAAVLGAGMGLLYSPQSGSDTRKQLRHYAKKSKVHATKIQRTMKSKAEKVVDYGKSILPKKTAQPRPLVVSA